MDWMWCVISYPRSPSARDLGHPVRFVLRPIASDKSRSLGSAEVRSVRDDTGNTWDDTA